MNFTKGLMLACGATGAVLAAVAGTHLFFDFDGPESSRDAALAPLTATLAPFSLSPSRGGDAVQVSVVLTVPGQHAFDIVCGHAAVLRGAAARLAAQQAGGNNGAAGTIPRDFDRALRARIAETVGDRVIERIEITVTPAGGTPPVANCPGAGL